MLNRYAGDYLDALAAADVRPRARVSGRLASYDGLLMEAVGLSLPVGTVCLIGAAGTHQVEAEVIGFRNGRTLMMNLGGAAALLPDAPLLTALSVSSGSHAGHTEVWVQGSRFNTRTRVYVGGLLAPRITVISDGLITLATPPAPPAAYGAASMVDLEDQIVRSRHAIRTERLLAGALEQSSALTSLLLRVRRPPSACAARHRRGTRASASTGPRSLRWATS